MHNGEVVDHYLAQRPFVPRDWLAEKVDLQLRDDACRHVLITADAGMGKSSFVAWLTTRHEVAPRYFIRLDSVSPFASGDSAHLLMSVGRQLAELLPAEPLRIEIHQRSGKVDGGQTGLRTKKLIANPFQQVSVAIHQKARKVGGRQVAIEADEVVDSEWLLTPEQLQQLALFEPAARLAEREPGAQLVVLIDGLDELRVGRGRGRTVLDWLTDCPQLPENVRIVATCRPDPDLLRMYRLRQRPRLREISIDPADAQVADDLRDYARQLIDDAELRQALGVSLEGTVRAVATRARGNFLYLVAWTRAVRHAISAGRSADLTKLAHELPADLEALHALFVWLLRDAAGPRWETTHRRVLAVLTVARGALTPAQIALMARTDEVDLALADMPQLITVAGGRVGMFHRSLADYLTAASTPPVHRIDSAVTNRESAESLIAAYGDDWSSCTDEYALANVVGHLVAALPDAWSATALLTLLADPGFARQKATVISPIQTVVDYAEAFVALRSDEIPRLLATQVVANRIGADTVQAGLGYRKDFDGFYGLLLDHLGDVDFVTAHAAASDEADLQPVSIWADFAEVLASRLRRNNDFDAATELLGRVAGVRGDQSRRLYESGYLHFLHGRVDEALADLDESVQAAEDAGRDVGRWISTLVRDQIALFADRIDHDEYASTLREGLEFFTAETRRGADHGPRWVMNVHNNMLTFACLRGDGAAAQRSWEVLSEDEWTRRERPHYLPLWEARMALAQDDFERVVGLYAELLGPDALDAEPPADEGIAWKLLDYGRALAGAGRPDDAVRAWRQVGRCADTTAAWPWKPKALALLSGRD